MGLRSDRRLHQGECVLYDLNCVLDLRPTLVKAYNEHDFATLVTVLKQNRRKLTVNPDTRTVQDAIERE